MMNYAKEVILFVFSFLISNSIYSEVIKDNRIFKVVKVDTSPGSAMIYLDNKKVGLSPQSLQIERINHAFHSIAALPLYKHHYRQDITLSKGNPPDKVQIFMDINPNEGDRTQESVGQSAPCSIYEGGFPSIYFETNTYALSDSQGNSIKAWVCHLLKEKNLPLIKIYGQADKRGPSKSNEILSLKRANAVKKTIAELDYPLSHIKVFGYGETRLLNSALKQVALKENRRIFLELDYNN